MSDVDRLRRELDALSNKVASAKLSLGLRGTGVVTMADLIKIRDHAERLVDLWGER